MWGAGLSPIIGANRGISVNRCDLNWKMRKTVLKWAMASGDGGYTLWIALSLVAILIMGSGCASVPNRDYDTLSYSGSGKLYLNGAEIERAAVAESLGKDKAVIIAAPSVSLSELKALYNEVMQAGVGEVELKRMSRNSTSP